MFRSGQGKNGAQDCFWVKRNNIQSWINRMGSLSIPEQEVRRIKKNRVGFYDLQTGEKWITSASNFKKATPVNGQVAVDVQMFDFYYRED